MFRKRFNRLLSWGLIALILFASTISPTSVATAQDVVRATPVASAAAPEARPVVRTAVVRIALRKIRREKLKEGDTAAVAVITQCLWDRDIMDAVAESICIKHAQENPQAPGDWVDEITKLIQWIIDNADEIIALIIKIIDLFAYVDPQPDHLYSGDSLLPGPVPATDAAAVTLPLAVEPRTPVIIHGLLTIAP